MKTSTHPSSPSLRAARKDTGASRDHWTDIRYDEWLPGPALGGIVTAYWRVVGDTPRGSSPVILPDGHIELVFNLGDRVQLKGPAYTGDQPDRVVVGPLSRAVRMKYGGQVYTFGIRFHPARGASFLGQTAPTLTDKLVPLAEICSVLDRVLRRLLAEHRNMDGEASRAALDKVLVEMLPLALPTDDTVVTLVDRLSQSTSSPRVSEVARELGLSSRQLQRRFLAAVGMPPKHFARVLRFARVWQLATMSPPETWGQLAAAHGYADQAHMVREFRAFGAEPPTRLFTPDWYDTTELSRVSGPAKGVRSVQDTVRKRVP